MWPCLVACPKYSDRQVWANSVEPDQGLIRVKIVCLLDAYCMVKQHNPVCFTIQYASKCFRFYITFRRKQSQLKYIPSEMILAYIFQQISYNSHHYPSDLWMKKMKKGNKQCLLDTPTYCTKGSFYNVVTLNMRSRSPKSNSFSPVQLMYLC